MTNAYLADRAENARRMQDGQMRMPEKGRTAGGACNFQEYIKNCGMQEKRQDSWRSMPVSGMTVKVMPKKGAEGESRRAGSRGAVSIESAGGFCHFFRP